MYFNNDSKLLLLELYFYFLAFQCGSKNKVLINSTLRFIGCILSTWKQFNSLFLKDWLCQGFPDTGYIEMRGFPFHSCHPSPFKFSHWFFFLQQHMRIEGKDVVNYAQVIIVLESEHTSCRRNETLKALFSLHYVRSNIKLWSSCSK